MSEKSQNNTCNWAARALDPERNGRYIVHGKRRGRWTQKSSTFGFRKHSQLKRHSTFCVLRTRCGPSHSGVQERLHYWAKTGDIQGFWAGASFASRPATPCLFMSTKSRKER